MFKSVNKLKMVLASSDYTGITDDTMVQLNVGCISSNNDLRITDTVKRLKPVFNYLYNKLSVLKIEIKPRTEDKNIAVTIVSDNDFWSFETHKTMGYYKYLKENAKDFYKDK